VLSSTLLEPPQRAASQHAQNVPPLVRGVAQTETLESAKARIRLTASQVSVNAGHSSEPAEANSTDAKPVSPQVAATAKAHNPQDLEIARQRALLKIQAVMLAQESFESAALAFCNELSSSLKAHRVSIGLFSKGHTKIAVTNNGDARKLDQSASKAIALAMDEALDQADLISAPELESSILINQAAQSVRRLHQGAVVAVPLLMNDKREAAFLFEFSKETQINRYVAAFLQDAVSLFGPLLVLMHRDELGWLARTRLSWSRKTKRVMGDDSRWMRWSAIAVVVALLIVSFVPTSHTVNSPARIEGAVMRAITAPAQGFIKKALVRPGDAVTLDQPLAELADRDLQLERNKIISEGAQHEGAYMTAMARNDRAAMVQAQSKQSEARAQLALIDQQLTRGVLLSPMDGIVLDGDLTQQIGSPVERGQNLMTVAPKNKFRTIVELDERDVRWVKVGQSASLSLSALPWDDVDIRVERINPMAVVRDGRNVFEVEASVVKGEAANIASQLRPGLRGVAKISVGEESIMNTYSRRAAEAVQRTWWRWAP
jgi:multidrug resistance efflux pump